MTEAKDILGFNNIIGRSKPMLEIFEVIKKVSDYKTTVMLYGESGTGKELIAKAIHQSSPRRNKPFIAINCGAIPENLLESELFGHKKGAFTDAVKDKKGLFEEAQGGTILLDEIGELPLLLQVKILRAIQENEIRPVGDNKSISTDVRIIAATLRDLENDIIDGKFREDLYYRLNVVSIKVPALRERKDDLPLLIDFFIKKHSKKLESKISSISKEALKVLESHNWPGNIRELENCLERAMILSEKDEIDIESLPKSVFSSNISENNLINFSTEENLSIKLHTQKLEEALIKKALEKTAGNRTHAAKLLEISHRTLLYKLKEYRLAQVSDDEI